MTLLDRQFKLEKLRLRRASISREPGREEEEEVEEENIIEIEKEESSIIEVERESKVLRKWKGKGRSRW